MIHVTLSHTFLSIPPLPFPSSLLFSSLPLISSLHCPPFPAMYCVYAKFFFLGEPWPYR